MTKPIWHRIFPGTALPKIKAKLGVEKYIGHCFSYYDWKTTFMMSESAMVTDIRTMVMKKGQGGGRPGEAGLNKKRHKRIFFGQYSVSWSRWWSRGLICKVTELYT